MWKSLLQVGKEAMPYKVTLERVLLQFQLFSWGDLIGPIFFCGAIFHKNLIWMQHVKVNILLPSFLYEA